MTALTHNYNGYAISQDSDGYTCLTDMAKAAGKLVGHYLELDSTKNYLDALSTDIGIPILSLVKVFKGGSGKQGTWAHPEVAIDFAAWCNVSFKIWANRTLRGVIEGKATPPRQDNTLAIRKLDLQIEIKKLELQKLELQREDYKPVQQELDLDIEERFKRSQQDLLKAKALENEYKASLIEQKLKPKQYTLSNIDNVESVEAYLKSCLKLEPSAKAYIGKADGNPNTHLYPNYVNYCVQNGLSFVPMQCFSKVLRQLAYTKLEVRLSKGRDRVGCHINGIAIAA